MVEKILNVINKSKAMNTKKLIILISAIALIAIALFSFQPKPESKNYQHLMIYSEHYDLDKVFISIDGKEYKRLELTQQIKGPWDFNPMINLIHQYENEGWELYSCFASGSSFYYLRKEKE